MQLANNFSEKVLILVLMEDTLGEQVIEQLVKNGAVLILVLMEDTLGGTLIRKTTTFQCLNPCFNGRYSRSYILQVCDQDNLVLILVLMEDTLGDRVLF